MDEIKKAMLGDKEAQRVVTDMGILLPCPICMCGLQKDFKNGIFYHPNTRCMLSGKGVAKWDIAEWNARPQILTAEEMEKVEKINRGCFCKECKFSNANEYFPEEIEDVEFLRCEFDYNRILHVDPNDFCTMGKKME